MDKLNSFLDKNNINKSDDKIKNILEKSTDQLNVNDLKYLSELSGFNPEAILSELLN